MSTVDKTTFYVVSFDRVRTNYCQTFKYMRFSLDSGYHTYEIER